MPPAERIELQDPSGSVMADLQAGARDARARSGGSRQLVDITPEAGARRPRAALGRGALDRRAGGPRRRPRRCPSRRSPHGENAAAPVPDPLARRGRPAARHGDRHLLGLGRRARHELLDLHRPDRRLDRRRLRRRALLARSARSPGRCTAARRRGCSRCSTRSRRAATPTPTCAALLDRGERIMGFGHRVYRAEDPRARVLRRTAQELGSPRVEVAEELERAALAALREKSPDRVLETNVEFWAAVVLDIAEIPPGDVPGDVRLRAGRGLVGAHRRAAAHRPPDPALGALRRRPGALAGAAYDARRGRERRPTRSPSAGDERELAALRTTWDEELEAAARVAGLPRAGGRLPGDLAVPLPPEDRAAAARARGREPGLPRLGARSRSRCSPATTRASINAMRPLLHEIVAHDGNDAVRRLAVMALRNGSAQRDTIAILAALGRGRRAGPRAARGGREGRAGAAAQGRPGEVAAQLLPPRVRVRGEVEPRAGARRRRACRARSCSGRRGRASPGRCAGRRRPRAGGWRRSGAAGAGGRGRARARPPPASRRRIRKRPSG